MADFAGSIGLRTRAVRTTSSAPTPPFVRRRGRSTAPRSAGNSYSWSGSVHCTHGRRLRRRRDRHGSSPTRPATRLLLSTPLRFLRASRKSTHGDARRALRRRTASPRQHRPPLRGTIGPRGSSSTRRPAREPSVDFREELGEHAATDYRGRRRGHRGLPSRRPSRSTVATAHRLTTTSGRSRNRPPPAEPRPVAARSPRRPRRTPDTASCRQRRMAATSIGILAHPRGLVRIAAGGAWPIGRDRRKAERYGRTCACPPVRPPRGDWPAQVPRWRLAGNGVVEPDAPLFDKAPCLAVGGGQTARP